MPLLQSVHKMALRLNINTNFRLLYRVDLSTTNVRSVGAAMAMDTLSHLTDSFFLTTYLSELIFFKCHSFDYHEDFHFVQVSRNDYNLWDNLRDKYANPTKLFTLSIQYS